MKRAARIRLVLSAFATLIGISLAVPASAGSDARVGIVQATSEFPASPPARLDSRSFYLSVPENRSDPDSRHIELPIVVLKANNKTTAAPVVMLTGGPGTPGLSAASYPGAYPWVGDRDFVIIGQRGTHHARPALMCRRYEAAIRSNSSTKQRVKTVRDCADALSGQGIDLSAYNTTESARDLEALRKAIGAERLTLYGLSYGTRLALSYARQYPDKVEALVLDSPLPFSANYDTEHPANIQSTLEAITALCAADDKCDANYPDLWSRFSARIERIAKTGPTNNGLSAAQIALYIVPGSLAEIAAAPRLMDAAARGDFTNFPAPATGGSSSNFAWGMRLSVWCSEAAETKAGASMTFAGINAPTFPPEICDAWPVDPRPQSELVDPVGDFPTLILAGELDAVTPKVWGERITSTLNNARLITVPAGLHGVTTNWDGTGCAMAIAAEFIADPDAFLSRALPDCLQSESYPAFETTE